MNHVASMNALGQESFFLKFLTWSVLLHGFFFIGVSFVQFGHTVEKPEPTVQVTFVEVPPEPEPQAAPEPEVAPSMLQPQRRQPQSLQAKQIPSSPPPPDISQPIDIPEVVAQAPPQPPSPQPVKRRILQDSRATDTLKARDMSKVASRRSAAPTATTKVDDSPSMYIPGFSTVAALEGVSSKHLVRASLPSKSPSRSKKTLQATGGEASAKMAVGVLRSVHPVYPRIAKKSGWEGTVLVRVTVESNGRLSHVTLGRTCGHEVLDHAAVTTVKRWAFRPAQDGNIPIRSIVVIPIKFSLSKHG